MATLNPLARLTLLALAFCLLFTGCRSLPLSLRDYPRVTQEEQAPELPPAQALTLVLPEGAPDSLLNMTDLLEAKLSQLSGGRLTLERQWVGERLALSDGDWDLALFTNDDLMALEPEMSFLAAPFLFPDRDSFLTILSQEEGPVRGNQRLRTALGGKIVALYYGGAMGFLCRTRLYDSLGFLGAGVGVLDTAAHTADFYTNLPELAAREVTVGDQWSLVGQLGDEDRPLRFVEYPRGLELPQEYREQAKYYEDTQHRFLGYWLTVADGVSPQVAQLVREAASYTLDSAREQQLDYEEWVMADLPPAHRDNAPGYPELYEAARVLYLAPDLRIGMSQGVWRQLRGLLR